MIPLLSFSEIEQDFRDTLLLGNGASMALDPCFSYKSLLQRARDDGLVTEAVQSIFSYLNSSDFELVMRMLRHAFHVNRALSIAETLTDRTYLNLRNALIRTVRAIHLGHAQVLPHIPASYTFLSRYDLALSLNYDLTVYWAMLRGNEVFGGNRFKDCWIHGEFDGDWERFKKPIGVEDSTLIFYPHGNLVLATSLTEGECKLTAEEPFGYLLDTIVRQWEIGDKLPLFVSEGETSQKEAAISRSGYLSTVFHDVMTDIGSSVTVYGWSMGDNDDHILRRVCAKSVSRIAVSVYRADRSDDQLQPDLLAIKAKVARLNASLPVVFFDAESPGCWLKTPVPE
jgi:hypothetical protein